jgi:Stress responsive A/B Barrel Domain
MKLQCGRSSIMQSIAATIFAASLFYQSTTIVEAKDSLESKAIVRHFVALKFKDSAKPEEIDEVLKEFKALKQKIPYVVSMEDGPNTSPEHLNKGFTHAFFLTFKNSADRDRYLVDPAHKAFVVLLKKSMEDGLVFDYSPN